MAETWSIDTGVVIGKNGSHVFTVAITDSGNSDAAVTPDSATWTLYDVDGTIINSRENVVLTPATSMAIATVTADNATEGVRRILIKAVADLASQANAPVRFLILYHVASSPEA